VWLDALTNYISALGYGEPDSKYDRYWPADVHLMAKEIVRFHTIIWPIILMAAGIPLPKQIFGHGWLVLEGEKISKSRGNVIDPVVLVERYGLDAVRYFLLRELPFGADGNYSEDALIRRTNVELANDLGNLLQRTLAMVERFAGGRVPTPAHDDVAQRPLPVAAARAWAAYADHMDRLELSNALGAVLELVGRANKYIEEQLPWDLAKEEGKRQQLATVLYDLLETLRVAAVLLYPALRRAPEGILRQIGLDPASVDFSLPAAAAWGGLPFGGLVHRAESLFPRIETEETVPSVAGSQPAGPQPTVSAPASVAEPAAAVTSVPSPDPDKQLVSYDEFAKLDLRVAEVLAAEPVKKADRLLKLQIRIGDRERQIIAGIAQHYRPADLVGKHIVVVANLAPAKIRGEESRGMLLAASTDEVLCLVVPEQSIASGARVK
jgi:methionyl-tRNA synthetase